MRLVAMLVSACALLPTVGAAQWLDPDRCWTCVDKREHFAAGAVIDVVLRPLVRDHLNTPLGRIALTCAVGSAYEGLQAVDAKRSGATGPGYGFSLLDLAATCVGAVVIEGAVWLGRRVF